MRVGRAGEATAGHRRSRGGAGHERFSALACTSRSGVARSGRLAATWLL